MSATVDASSIADGLRRVGVRPNTRVMVHSSLKSFGHVDGGADAVIDALCGVVSPGGIVMMPSFNHGAPFQVGACGFYDPTSTPTSNGIIPDIFWRRPGVYRSLNPTHPFAAWGADAPHYVEYHHRTLTMGPDSPLGLLLADDGLCLMLGTNHETNTLKHVAETSYGAKCLGRRIEAYPVLLPTGRTVFGRTWGWRSRDCPLTESGTYIQAEMERRELHRKTRVGTCQITAFCLRDCLNAIKAILQEGRDHHPPCHRCPIRPGQNPHTCDSDWDDASDALKSDSVAWTY